MLMCMCVLAHCYILQRIMIINKLQRVMDKHFNSQTLPSPPHPNPRLLVSIWKSLSYLSFYTHLFPKFKVLYCQRQETFAPRVLYALVSEVTTIMKQVPFRERAQYRAIRECERCPWMRERLLSPGILGNNSKGGVGI